MKKHNNRLSKQYKKRIKTRSNVNEKKQSEKKQRIRANEADVIIRAKQESVLKNRKKNDETPPKRPGAEKFLALFAFLPAGCFDKRHMLIDRNSWSCHSFNEKRQTMEFFRTFIYPFPVPEPLIITSIKEDLYNDKNSKLRYSKDFSIIQKSKKWLSDIVCGGSFYKKNKDYFTKTEAHYFLSSQCSYTDNSSLIAMYFEAKCKARNFGQSLCTVVTKVFTLKFFSSYDCSIVTGFLDLLARHADYHITADELGDICDFVNTKITQYQQGNSTPFSFSGRTISSVTALANEWHAQHQRELRLLGRLGNNIYQNRSIPEKWDGLGVNNFRHESKRYIWSITQLLSVHKLINEGRKMKHCVASYAYKCSKHECAIFNVSCLDKDMDLIESTATIEVSSHHEIVQIKGRYNAAVSGKVMGIIARWVQQERLKVNSIYQL